MLTANYDLGERIERDPYFKAFDMMKSQPGSFKNYIRAAEFEATYNDWCRVKDLLLALKKNIGQRRDRCAERLAEAYCDVKQRPLEQEFLRLYHALKRGPMGAQAVRAPALLNELDWSEWTPQSGEQQIDLFEIESETGDRGPGKIAVIDRVVAKGIRNAKGQIISKPKAIIRWAPGSTPACALRPGASQKTAPLREAPAGAPHSSAPPDAAASPRAERIRELLPVLKRVFHSLGSERGARCREMYEPYLEAAENPNPSNAVLNTLADIHNPIRFLPLLDSSGNPPELEFALGLERLPLPAGLLRPADLADYNIASTSGAGDRFRVIRELEPGYRLVKSGEIIRKTKVDVRAE